MVSDNSGTATQQLNFHDYEESPNGIQLDSLQVREISRRTCKQFMERYHYSGGLGNAAMSWGAFDTDTGQIVGAIAFQTPISENTRDSIFGNGVCGCQLVDPKECDRDGCRVRGDHHHLGEHVTELHRLAVVPSTPKNTGSWLISRGLTQLKSYKPKYWAVISMADSTEDHDGTQYQAANADYYGMTESRVEYIDNDGRLRSPRQCGENISHSVAEDRGWKAVERDGKHRYVFWLPYRSGRSKQGLREFADIEIKTYPQEHNE